MSDGTDRENAPAFIVANFIVKNSDEYHKYEKGFFPLLKRHGGSFVTYDDEHETLEGIAPRTGRMVIFSFPTEEHARQWWAESRVPDPVSASSCRMRDAIRDAGTRIATAPHSGADNALIPEPAVSTF
jgi:uncharacterized protein (DUF1330 family)